MDVYEFISFKYMKYLYYIVGHNYHEHYFHAGVLSVNNYVREIVSVNN